MKTDGKKTAKELALLQQQIIEACRLITNPQNVSKGITKKTRLKKDLDLKIYEFGSLLAEVFNVTGWVNNYGEIIAGYNAMNDLSIEELAKQLMLKK